MNKHFYSHIIEINTLVVKIEKSNFSKEEKNNLLTLVEYNIHHKVVDVVLSELKEEEDKNIFLKLLAQDEHDRIWNHLKEKAENIEEKIKNALGELVEEFHKDLEN